jgi:putative protease
MDLLAPAGTVESFYAAVENGADAIYLGLKNFSARAYAKNFTVKELALLLHYARKKKVKVNIALNSLTKESELPEAVHTLAVINELRPNAVIVQDLGIYHLTKSHFPRLNIHGSVLMTVHNSLGARQLYNMGFKRAVLAREMSLKEIAAVSKSCPIELETFVHGALCYSYSGLCLFSSYLGGRGSTRGRCTQPCRRRYKAGKRAGYFFSPSDLSTIDFLPELKKLGIKAIKIEGRMRSATYVAAVVKAYRLALDSLGTDNANALDQAKKLITESMGRRLSAGFYTPVSHKNILAPNISGNIGQFLGKVTGEAKNRATICIKDNLYVGDRIRAHFPETDERKSVTLRGLAIEKKATMTAKAGQTVTLTLPFHCPPGTALFKVDRTSSGINLAPKKIWEVIKKSAGDPQRMPKTIPNAKIAKIISYCEGQKTPGKQRMETLSFRFNLTQHIPDTRPLAGHRIIMNLSKNEWSRFSKTLSVYQKRKEMVCWSLPPIIHEKDVFFFQKLTAQLLKKGFRNWEITNLGHLQFFKKSKVTFQAGHQINLMNSCAFKAAGEMGITSGVISIEAGQNDIKGLLQKRPFPEPAITIYGHPPLFTSRLIPQGLKHGHTVTSTRKERYSLSIVAGISYLVPQQPFSLVPFQIELRKMGCSNFIIDLSYEAKPMVTLANILNKKYMRNCSHFNYKRGLQ